MLILPYPLLRQQEFPPAGWPSSRDKILVDPFASIGFFYIHALNPVIAHYSQAGCNVLGCQKCLISDLLIFFSAFHSS